ncbi:MAG: hypothetical protein JWQ87_71 [Candidatus Sulfotelmatobacter sp.]|nr:hypothetical protein [Candidatus Sulfotelmatobacter sp.]
MNRGAWVFVKLLSAVVYTILRLYIQTCSQLSVISNQTLPVNSKEYPRRWHLR